MGGCQGARRAYTEPTQKLCRQFEDCTCLCNKDWRLMVSLIRSYAHTDGAVPPENMTRIMEEAGLKEAYCSNDTRLRQMMTEYVGDRTPQSEHLTYLMLFMCCGKDADRARYFCTVLNEMDPSKETVNCEKLCNVLCDLMRLSTLTIPEMAGKDKFEDYEKMKALDMATMVKLWCPECCTGDTVACDKVVNWVTKRCAFCTGEARAVVMDKIRPPAPVVTPTASKETTQQTAKTNA